MNKLVAILVAAVLIAGCAESTRPVATGKGTIRGINASSTSPAVAMLLEERLHTLAIFKGASAVARWDDFEYNVNFNYQFTGELNATRLLTIPFKMEADNDHLFIFTGTIYEPDSLLWTNPSKVWETTDTTFQAWFGNLSPILQNLHGEVDIYFGLTGTLPVLGEQRATLANGNRSAFVDIEAGEYELIITPKDDPTNILYQSAALVYGAANNSLFAVFDPDPSITSPIALRVIQPSGSSTELPDVNTDPTLRVLHLAQGTVDADLYRDTDVTPWIAGATFGVPTAEVPTPSTLVPYTFTEAGNVGAPLLEAEFGVNPGLRLTRFLTGDPATLVTTPLVDDIRNIDDVVRMRFYQASFNQDTVDIYLVAPGTIIGDVGARFFAVPYRANTGYVNIAAADYQIYATPFNDKTVLAGPYDITGVAGDVIHFALADTADPNVLEWIEYDHLSAPVVTQ